MKFNLLISLLFILTEQLACSQTIIRPNFGMKSHETLEIDSIVTDGKTSIASMVIENKSPEGFFCADTNIYILLPQNKKLKLIKSEGIPVCPESYHFKTFGEKLRFRLIFPPVPPNISWIDLIEECNFPCFSFNTVIMDIKLNQEIDAAYNLMNGGKNAEAIIAFEKIMEEIKSIKLPLEGNILMNLIFLNLRTGNRDKAKGHYETLKNPKTTFSEKYLEILETSGIVF